MSQRIPPRVEAICASRHIPLDAIHQGLEQPETTYPGRPGSNATVHVRGTLAVIVQGGRAVAITPHKPEPVEPRCAAPTRPRSQRRGSGPSGRRGPTTVSDLISTLHAEGFLTERSGGHYVLSHPRHPGQRLTVPCTPSDHRAIPNAVAVIRRTFGVDLRAAA